MTEGTSLADLEKSYREAKEAHETARRESSRAQSVECDALNRLNDAQKALDAAYLKLVSDAPHRSDWGQRRQTRERA